MASCDQGPGATFFNVTALMLVICQREWTSPQEDQRHRASQPSVGAAASSLCQPHHQLQGLHNKVGARVWEGLGLGGRLGHRLLPTWDVVCKSGRVGD